MIKHIITTLLLIGVLMGCMERPVGVGRDGVDQSIGGKCENLCNPSESNVIGTYIWIDGEIIFSSYISVTASQKQIAHQLDSANTIFNNLKATK